MYIEVHMIQSFAPSNLNRDDTGSPKDCEFGGVRRARISSQCIKRAIREEPIFAETTGVEMGTRTRRMADRLKRLLIEADQTDEEAEVVALAFTEKYVSKTDDKGRTNVLVYLSPEEFHYIADQMLADWDAALKQAEMKDPFKALVKEMVKATKGRTSAPDIAMFGRMLANEPQLNLDAACQVAHAISTHRVTMEMDFFTAVDDLKQTDEDAGAGMMGFTGFNSACFYRYARIDWGQLVQNLDGDTGLARRTVEGFLRAANQAVPSGKQNSFAAQNPPSFLMAVVRNNGMSWSMANAFENPVYVSKHKTDGLVGRSVEALDTYWERLNRVYDGDGVERVAALTIDPGIKLEHLQAVAVDTFAGWVQAVVDALPKGEAV